MEGVSLKIVDQIENTALILQSMAQDAHLVGMIETIASACTNALKNNNKLLFMGNGGSAADAQHLAGELVSRFAYDRPGLPAFALTTDTSVMTAIGNDYGYHNLFGRQVQAVGNPGDVIFGISTSGSSPNVLIALERARATGLVTVGMTGNQRASIIQLVDYCVEIPSSRTPQIQEGHIVVGHIICGLIEAEMYPRSE